MDLTWKLYDCPEPEREYRFHSERKWLFDYAWPSYRCACEIEGGIWTRGRHTRALGYLRDMEKYNEAQKLGWRIFRFTPQELKKGIAQAFIKEVLK